MPDLTHLWKKKKLYTQNILLFLLPIMMIMRCCGCFTSCGKQTPSAEKTVRIDTIVRHSLYVDTLLSRPRPSLRLTDAGGKPIKNKVRGVGDYDKAFPDMNDLQLATAQRLGIPIIADRDDAHRHKKDLVYIGDNPYYRVRRLTYSIPYLVPRAERLLTEIARNFIDSLQRKGFPGYKLEVTSVLRTQKDVSRLRRVNCNASENSCHQHGTTFDICYNSYHRIIDPDNPEARQVWDGRLKDILAEVLRDQRDLGTCYVRYERKQACFHITAR